MEIELRGPELAVLDALAQVTGNTRAQVLAAALQTLALERLCHYSNQVGGQGDDALELEAAAKGRMRRIVRALNGLPSGARYRLRGPYLQVQAANQLWRRCFDFRWL